MVVVRGVVHVNLQTLTQFALVFVERRLKPDWAQYATLQPLRSAFLHLCQHRIGINIMRTKDLQRSRRATSFRERCALQHYRACIGTRHAQIRCVWTGVNPTALVLWPAVIGRGLKVPVLHRNDAKIHVDIKRTHKPMRQLAHGQTMTHRHLPRADKTLPPRTQGQTLHGTTRRIGAIEYPNRFMMFGCGFEHITQGRDEGINTTTQVL